MKITKTDNFVALALLGLLSLYEDIKKIGRLHLGK